MLSSMTTRRACLDCGLHVGLSHLRKGAVSSWMRMATPPRSIQHRLPPAIRILPRDPTAPARALRARPHGEPAVAGEISPDTLVTTPQTSPSSTTPTMLAIQPRSEEHTSELQSLRHLVCRLLLEKK